MIHLRAWRCENRSLRLLPMPRFTDEAICIRHWDFSETSQTVSLFSRSHGLIRGLAKGSKREKSRFCGGIELLTSGQITAITKKTTDLANLIEWDLEGIYPVLSRNLQAWRIGMYIADLCQHFLHEQDPHPNLFGVLQHTLRSLEQAAAQGQLAGQLLQFQWAVLLEAGYRPILDRDANTSESFVNADGSLNAKTFGFSAKSGGTVIDTGHSDRWRVRRPTIELLRIVAAHADQHQQQLNEGNGEDQVSILTTLSEQESSTDSIARANKLLAAYIRTILDRDLNTLKDAIGEIRL